MHSYSFDRAASFYDDTRKLPDEISERITQTILALGLPDRPILEAGVGTGRIAAPLLKRGARLFGVDLSKEMMLQLRAKFDRAPLAQADVSRLPFPDAAFGTLITVHVLHLVGPWREALREFRRVLEPNGVYLNSHNYRASDSPNQRLRQRWHEMIEERGYSGRRPGAKDHAELTDELRGIGTRIEEVAVGEWVQTVTPQQELDSIAARIHSDTWSVPDALVAASIVELRNWAKTEYADLNIPIPVARRFIFDVIHF